LIKDGYLISIFLNKADFLGDRIAIMSQGKLRCVGSPLFLKSKYGSGYNLTITRKQKEEEETLFKYPNSYTNLNESNQVQIKINPKNLANENAEKALVKKICTLVKNKVPRSQLKTSLVSELSFQLPAEDSHRFPDLFDLLDRNKRELNILNIGISVTTVEEVFLK
jgi:ABC-type multidrug transport system ATPase subunit